MRSNIHFSLKERIKSDYLALENFQTTSTNSINKLFIVDSKNIIESL